VTQLTYRAGRVTGGHDRGDIGAYTLYRDGWLVVSPGDQDVEHGTASATLTIDGHAQHHDGMAIPDTVPEPASGSAHQNNGRMVGYFDDHATSIGGQVVNVVTVATDLTQMYRVDSSDLLRASSFSNTTFTDIEGTDGELQSLRRYLVWIADGQAIYTADQWRTTRNADPWSFGWYLPANEYLIDTGTDGIRDPNTCNVDAVSTTGNCASPAQCYEYRLVGTATVLNLRYSGRTTQTNGILSDSSPPTRSWLNQRAYVPDTSSCSAVYMGLVPPTSTASLQPYDTDRLDVKVMDAYSNGFNQYPTPIGDGGKVQGHHYHRWQEREDGMFLTRLRPYDRAANPVAAAISSGVVGGQKGVIYASGYDVETWFRDPASTAVYDGAGGEVVGDLGVLAHATSSYTPRYALQMMNGTRFTANFDDLVTSSNAISIGLHWLNGGTTVAGWLEQETTSTSQITIDMGAISAASVTQVVVGGTSYTPTYPGSNTIRFSTALEGPIYIRTASGSAAAPRTSCTGQ
jgi:hypothetical protein